MRLLRCDITDKLRPVEFFNRTLPPYAILSHTWEADDEEVTFRDILDDTGQNKSGYKKIRFCAKQAKKDGLQFIWVDSCCIDKSSSAELSEAINSMFCWYQGAEKCYVYLSDVSAKGASRGKPPPSQGRKLCIHHSRWFTRSWTLQELLAPRIVEFFSQEWKHLGSKTRLVRAIGCVTKIPDEALLGIVALSQFSINERMSWAEGRNATREEDTAYSLLGIFNVHMPLIYGEGQQNAFARLRREIGRSTHSTQFLAVR
ncbi:heterokaryon incompatibility protein-domain-containing protein [Xylaria bambusicola]|uniref:heterokaryon incompatibility protein-domain-containing protein n=1 Tax=Xylaria bambusicola TaxID=326684 RepID=UPI002008292D|nr:heterokaryon incompatibility protein-domain-containing protein [Xylaria bambusicola]KAI0505320.1 heterokaryon incompatibility protein-domain-containing protein [Xylaria bambusicola]